jgi:formamidopyrimidine-DNA glycosylase
VPELPEVETVVRDLRPLLAGRTLGPVRLSDRALRRPWEAGWSALLDGRRVEGVRRRGKWIVLDFEDGARLLVHLGMTGQFTVRAATDSRQTHTHLTFPLDDGRELRFRDIRRFGSATYYPDEPALAAYFTAQKLGPEPFGLDPEAWRLGLKRTTRVLKAALLDQRLVAGVGNIYADESLFEARLKPTRRGTATTRAEAERLRLAIEMVLARAIVSRGSSIRNYVGGSGLQGGYQEEFRVYGRTGEPCRVCERPVRQRRLAGRSTHYCSQCQR